MDLDFSFPQTFCKIKAQAWEIKSAVTTSSDFMKNVLQQ
jgi:hypothetical protein